MKIKDIKSKYKNYNVKTGEHNSFVVYDYGEDIGKVVIVVNVSKIIGDYVTAAIRVSDGKNLISSGRCRPCDNLEDAIDVAGEMF